MRLNSSRVEKTPQLMIIPMIDIIFFLLVFFMLSTLYMTDQQVVPVNLPQAASAQTDVVKSMQVTVANQPMELNQLVVQVKEASRGGNTALVLRADGDVDYASFMSVLDELKKSGVQRISLAVKK